MFWIVDCYRRIYIRKFTFQAVLKPGSTDPKPTNGSLKPASHHNHWTLKASFHCHTIDIMSDLNDCLKLQIKGSPLTGESSLASHVRPSASGFKWLASPSSMAGLAYRINGSTILERLEFDDESDINVSASIAVDNAVVHLAASFGGGY